MVIQRVWKVQSESLQHQSASSDDSNGSSQTVSSSNTSSSKAQPQAIKYVTTPQMADSVLSRLKQRFGTQITGPKSSSEAVMRSLELLRINIQKAFDKEIDTVVKRFTEDYFKPAFKNIKQNLGETSVSDDVLQKMSCALLENSKSQYNSRAKANITTASNATSTLTEALTIRPEISTQSKVSVKRPTSSIPAEFVPALKKVALTANAPPITLPTISTQLPERRQIFWNTASVNLETKFLLDVQANQAFGFGTDGKERLASKHPELIRYLPDGEDREWLVQQKIIPAEHKNSRFLFLIYDEVIRLGKSEQYRNKESVNLAILHAFKIPNFIIQKMRMFFIDLNIKSRGLITNSFSVGQQLRNALMQRSHSPDFDNQPTPSNRGRSSLSLSHATLTALLTSNNDISQQPSVNSSVSG